MMLKNVDIKFQNTDPMNCEWGENKFLERTRIIENAARDFRIFPLITVSASQMLSPGNE